MKMDKNSSGMPRFRVGSAPVSIKPACFRALLALAMFVPGLAQSSLPPAYLDTTLSFEQRARDLVSRMTLEEKAAPLINDASAIPRLNVREFNWWSEGLHGVAAAGVATVFPQAIGMAATWNAPLMEVVASRWKVTAWVRSLVYPLPLR